MELSNDGDDGGGHSAGTCWPIACSCQQNFVCGVTHSAPSSFLWKHWSCLWCWWWASADDVSFWHHQDPLVLDFRSGLESQRLECGSILGWSLIYTGRSTRTHSARYVWWYSWWSLHLCLPFQCSNGFMSWRLSGSTTLSSRDAATDPWLSSWTFATRCGVGGSIAVRRGSSLGSWIQSDDCFLVNLQIQFMLISLHFLKIYLLKIIVYKSTDHIIVEY